MWRHREGGHKLGGSRVPSQCGPGGEGREEGLQNTLQDSQAAPAVQVSARLWHPAHPGCKVHSVPLSPGVDFILLMHHVGRSDKSVMKSST